MTNVIQVEVKDVYGTLKYYPLCEKAQLFADIAGTKTLSEVNLRRILELGYEIATYEQRYVLPETLRREK